MKSRAAATVALLAALALVGCTGTPSPETPQGSEAMKNYGLMISQAIAEEMPLPQDVAPAQRDGVALVYFTLDRDGNVKETVLEQSSGLASLDTEAVAAVRRAAPFGKVPDEFSGDTLEVRMPLQFRRCQADDTNCLEDDRQ